MENSQLVYELVLALGVAFLGGMLAQRLGLPVLLGYIVAGVIVGPSTPGPVADRHQVELLANLGVALLMFGLGVEFSLSQLKRVRNIAFVSACIQLPLTGLLGTLAGQVVGWSWPASLLLGGGFAISSSIVALKFLLGRGEGTSPQAGAALGLGVIQDLSLVPMIALLPALSGEGDHLVLDLVRSMATAGIALVLVFVLGTRLVPRILSIVARTQSRELFLLSIVLIALGTAAAREIAGLSLALGAFLAGLVVSESEFDAQVLAEIIPLRDVFATLFFVSVGMLLDPVFLLGNWITVAALVAVLVVGKLLITGGAMLAAGVDHRTATIVAVLMAQMGEFSFVLATVGLDENVISQEQYGMILAAALGSIMLVPAGLAGVPTLSIVAERLPAVARRERAQAGPELESPEPLARHVVICGYGRVGTALGDSLHRRGLRYSVIDLNAPMIRELRARGVTAFYGDAGSEPLLMKAGIQHARLLVVATPDLVTARGAILHARQLNSRIEIVARATSAAEMEILREAGADAVVQPEFEAATEFVRHVLRRYGITGQELQLLLSARRDAHYGDHHEHSEP